MRKVIFNSSEAMLEAKRCLSCNNPSCEKGCPIGNHIRDFIKALKDDNLALAEKIVFDNSNLAFICSLVCPHEKNCIGNCILNHKKMPINVGALEAYITSNTLLKAPEIIENGKRVAIVGAGPAGINAAIELRKSGYSVTIYDAFKHIGGVMSYGIPEYRIDRKALLRLEALVNDYKIHLKLNTFLKEEDILKLKEGYDKVVIAVGLTKSRDLGIGESKRIIKASTLLREYNLKTKYDEGNLPSLSGRVIVVGAGNVAMDAARVALRLGADVSIYYRRSREEAPATNEEIELAISEGVKFNFLVNPVLATEIGNGLEVKMNEMELGAPDESGRLRPVSTDKYFTVACDYLISAIGEMPADLGFTKLKANHGYLECDSSYLTNIEGIYTCGDITLGAKTVVEACQSGKKVAETIINSDNRQK